MSGHVGQENSLHLILNISGSHWRVLRRKERCSDPHFKKVMAAIVQRMNFRVKGEEPLRVIPRGLRREDGGLAQGSGSGAERRTWVEGTIWK